jgi:hypothetical protein
MGSTNRGSEGRRKRALEDDLYPSQHAERTLEALADSYLDAVELEYAPVEARGLLQGARGLRSLDVAVTRDDGREPEKHGLAHRSAQMAPPDEGPTAHCARLAADGPLL